MNVSSTNNELGIKSKVQLSIPFRRCTPAPLTHTHTDTHTHTHTHTLRLITGLRGCLTTGSGADIVPGYPMVNDLFNVEVAEIADR